MADSGPITTPQKSFAKGLLIIFARTGVRCRSTRRVDGDLNRRDGGAAAEIDGDLGRDPSADQGPCCGAGAIAGVGGRGRGKCSPVACLVGVGGVVAGDEVDCPGGIARRWKPAS